MECTHPGDKSISKAFFYNCQPTSSDNCQTSYQSLYRAICYQLMLSFTLKLKRKIFWVACISLLNIIPLKSSKFNDSCFLCDKSKNFS